MIRILGVGNSLVTGLQGAGKSHFIMSQVKEILDSDNTMKIYIANVDGIKLQASNLHIVDADFNWVKDAENNSLIIYDEAGTIERFNNSSRKINSNEQVLKLTMARHQNKTIVFIAQDSSIVHPSIRKLLTRHFHFSNPYNNQKETHCFIFPQVQDRLDGQNKAWQKNAVEEFKHTLDADIFPLYKSVDDNVEHSKKKQVNKKAQLLFRIAIFSVVVAIPLFIVMIYFAYSYYQDNINAENVQKKISATTSQTSNIVQNSADSVSQSVSVNNNASQEIDRGNRIYIRTQQLYQERLPADYEIIANNDDLRIAGAVRMRSKCIAYNQRGERLNVSQSECERNLEQVGNMMKSRRTSSVVTSHNDVQTQTDTNSDDSVKSDVVKNDI